MIKDKVTSPESVFMPKHVQFKIDNHMKIPSKKKKKENGKIETKAHIDNKKENQSKTKRKSTYDPRIFRAAEYEPKFGRFDDSEPIKLTVTLKDIGLEGLDSYEPSHKQEFKPSSPPKSNKKVTENSDKIKVTEDAAKMNEEMRMKKIQEEWELRKKLEKQINTYDPDIFLTPACLPSPKSKPEDAEPIKLNVELKDIGMEEFESSKTKNKKDNSEEIKPTILPKPKIKKKNDDDEDDPSKKEEQMRMKKIQEEWEIRKDVEKHMNTYSPFIFRASAYSAKRKIKPEDIDPIQLSVELKDIGMANFDSNRSKSKNKQDKTEEIKPRIPPKPKVQKTEDPDKLNEEMRMKKIQEEWELRKKLEKEINTYDPSIFYAPAHWPSPKSKPEDVEPIKLNVELKDIGMANFDSNKSKEKNKQENLEEIKPRIPPKPKIKTAEDIEKLNEEKRMKRIQEDWEMKKEIEKEINTYDPSIFWTNSCSPRRIKPKPKFITPVKLDVELKDIGMEDFNSNKTESKKDNSEEIKPRIPLKPKIKKTEDDAKKLEEEMRMKKIQEEWELRKEEEKHMNTYDPKIFQTSEFSIKKYKPENIEPVKLNVNLKDIGMEDFDSNKTENKKDNSEEIKLRIPYKRKVKKTEDDAKKLEEQMRMKKIQEEWELRKEVEKHMNTYDPKIFRASAYSPRRKDKKENIEPIKLNVDLKDIGLEGLDSYKQSSPSMNKKENRKNNNDEQKKFIVEKPNEASPNQNIRTKRNKEESLQNARDKNTCNSIVYKTTFVMPTNKQKNELRRSHSPLKSEIRKQKENEYVSNSQKRTNSSIKIQKINDNCQRKGEKEKRKSTYDPSIFATSSCAFKSAKLTAQKIEPVKLNVTLKDIGLEGLDCL